MIVDLFSKRQKRLRGEVPEVYVYDEIPENLRVQIVHIIRDAFGVDIGYRNDVEGNALEAYIFINNTLCREYGVFHLNNQNGIEEQIFHLLLTTKNFEQVLDVIELSFRVIIMVIKKNYNYTQSTKVRISPDDAVIELNGRLKENGIGYSFEGNELMRVDSTYIHSEITKPTLSLLWDSKFTGANEEYLKAHDHYRHGRNKEALTECLKAFESTLKIICIEKGWIFKSGDNAKKLIQICFDNQLIPSFTQNQFTSLLSLIESGVPTIRNKLGGHGQGQIPQKVDDEMTRYALNLTGSNIIFLVEQSNLTN